MATKQIPGFSRYEVSDEGWVRNKDGLVLKNGVDKWGYNRRPLVRDDGKKVCLYAHRLVAEAFVAGYAPGMEVDHIDGDANNNRAENLRWVSRADNMRFAIERHGNWLARAPKYKRAVVGVSDSQIVEYESITKAAESHHGASVKGARANICAAIKRGVWCYGYKWKYKDGV